MTIGAKGAALVALAALTACNRPSAAAAKFSIVADSGGGAWRLNETTGEIAHCAAPAAAAACMVVYDPAPLSPEREKQLKKIFGF